MTETKKCAKCGQELPPDAPEGLCPKCLLEAGLESETGLADDFETIRVDESELGENGG